MEQWNYKETQDVLSICSDNVTLFVFLNITSQNVQTSLQYSAIQWTESLFPDAWLKVAKSTTLD